ncbi:MAG: Hpt domain-containing protein [Microcoleus sp. PH2017_01_SCD_O_A]|uniref:Hpt domain-containing protein n=1 Tax=unclassified Microcoleus TaxID=2642155 RepID=UPI001DE97A49|nr:MULTISPECIES: Hpt domain-containing protein [unclassified Microcoleus]MCC3431579.1 Hpt domain-containing protein [Microcoleus sp. PH2017_04_SCI_O_A]MCC3442158.1 Hpt domain-containing protein [Microcoleus sp. PH2017_03_ELD_O_A]TAE07952.1 MAG: phosphotransferase [Oscillatoriales cyanobacterium]MCC3426055.1 Hpt domain-containing protein [Microcoleus sp. PH2017_01_SCD_O_A]MCC3493628.1 Hpt domain-containing protein [Microcoleus sp. PH2017_16_JOR_D_A]
MLPEQLQRIIGYFLEEATEHLQIMEQGLQGLQNTVQTPQRIHQLIRASHSVKGGAAMLGFSSIQRVAHRLEDYLKLLRECPIAIDSRLQSLLTQVFDILVALVSKVSKGFGLNHEDANQMLSLAEPIFDELDAYLRVLIPTRLSVRAVTDEHIHLFCGYCTLAGEFSSAITSRVGLLGGNITRQEYEGDGIRLYIDIYLPPYTRIENIRQAVELSGAIIGTVQTQRDFSLLAMDYPVYQSAIEPPAICTGCRYYYGRSDGGHLLNCTIHPRGPEDEDCRDREPE